MSSKGTVVMAFSLDARTAAYVNGAGQGRRSALVRRALASEMHRQEVLDNKNLRSIWQNEALDDDSGTSIHSLATILQSRDRLQEELLTANEKIEELERHLRVKKVLTPPPRGRSGKKGIPPLQTITRYLGPFLLSAGILIALVSVFFL